MQHRFRYLVLQKTKKKRFLVLQKTKSRTKLRQLLSVHERDKSQKLNLRVKLKSEPVVLTMTSHFDDNISPLITSILTAFSCFGVGGPSSDPRIIFPRVCPILP